MATKKNVKAQAKAPAKKAPKPIKVGDKVTFTRRNGEAAAGKVVAVTDAANGRWLNVNVAAPKTAPKIAKVRESEVTKV